MSETTVTANQPMVVLAAPKIEDGKIALGHYPLPGNTFEHDLSVSDRYQSFSAELLRLALLGITAIGFIITNILFRTTSPADSPVQPAKALSPEFKSFVALSLAFLGASALCALLHRYYGADSIAYHLESLRRDIRQAPKDDELAKKERAGRRQRFRFSGWLLISSAIFLWLGAVSLIVSFVGAI